MPTTVIADTNQTLCELAIAAGFVDCQPIRDLADNAGQPFLTQPLAKGDRVVIPDVDTPDHPKPVEAEHKFQKKNAPAFAIRFVHGTPDKPYAQDPTIEFLNVSNYITNKCGVHGRDAFPSATGFNQNAHVDEDAFKVEVVDPSGAAPAVVKLDALKAVYDDTGALDHHELFQGDEAGKRSLTVNAAQLSGKAGFRTPYLRLVVDDDDKAALPDQTLLVTDMADGNNGDNDRVEILDQVVRASYVRQNCPGTPKCTAVTEAPIAPDRQRIKLCVHGVRANVGDATAIGGVTEQNIRYRTMRWYRRLYAQAHLAPQLVDPNVDFVDPPSDNMIVIGEHTGATASGINGAGAASSITFTLGTSPPAGAGDPPDPVVTVNLGGSATPRIPEDVGGLIAAAMPAGFIATNETNCRAFDAANGSCDILITRTDGKRVMITNESTDDTGLLAGKAFAVCRVNLDQVNIDTPVAALLSDSMDVRRVLRTTPSQDGRIDFYVVGGLFGINKDGNFANVARGLAMVPGASVPAEFQPNESCRFAALMGKSASQGPVMDGGDHDPYSYPHEGGHVIHDGFHTKKDTPGGATEMMSGNGTTGFSDVAASKRICDLPVKIIYQMFDPDPNVQNTTPGKFTNAAVSASARMLANGTSVFGAF